MKLYKKNKKYYVKINGKEYDFESRYSRKMFIAGYMICKKEREKR